VKKKRGGKTRKKGNKSFVGEGGGTACKGNRQPQQDAYKEKGMTI